MKQGKKQKLVERIGQNEKKASATGLQVTQTIRQVKRVKHVKQVKHMGAPPSPNQAIASTPKEAQKR
jgi:hypothetical protein